MNRLVYKMISICPNAGQATFKAKAPEFLKRGDIFPSFLEGLSATPKGPQTHILISMPLSEKNLEDFEVTDISIANLFWWIVDLETSVCVRKSINANQPTLGETWTEDQAIEFMHVNRLYNAKI